MEKISDAELEKLIRDAMGKINLADRQRHPGEFPNGSDRRMLSNLLKPLRDAGISAYMHEGKTKEMKPHTKEARRMRMEFFAGQLIGVVGQKKWGMIHSVGNRMEDLLS